MVVQFQCLCSRARLFPDFKTISEIIRTIIIQKNGFKRQIVPILDISAFSCLGPRIVIVYYQIVIVSRLGKYVIPLQYDICGLSGGQHSVEVFLAARSASTEVVRDSASVIVIRSLVMKIGIIPRRRDEYYIFLLHQDFHMMAYVAVFKIWLRIHLHIVHDDLAPRCRQCIDGFHILEIVCSRIMKIQICSRSHVVYDFHHRDTLFSAYLIAEDRHSGRKVSGRLGLRKMVYPIGNDSYLNAVSFLIIGRTHGGSLQYGIRLGSDGSGIERKRGDRTKVLHFRSLRKRFYLAHLDIRGKKMRFVVFPSYFPQKTVNGINRNAFLEIHVEINQISGWPGGCPGHDSPERIRRSRVLILRPQGVDVAIRSFGR